MRQRIEPQPGQESVWDYPRPPALEPTEKTVRVLFNGEVVAETTRAVRVLETSHPPTYYIPPDDIRAGFLTANPHRTVCEYKGVASYWDLKVGDRISRRAAWSYPNPTPAFDSIRGYVAFYPSRVDEATVDGERVRAQEGDFYGGWITKEIVGPFKGGRGTMGW